MKSPTDCQVLESYGLNFKMDNVNHFLFMYTKAKAKDVVDKWTITCYMCYMETKDEPLPNQTPAPEPGARAAAIRAYLVLGEASGIQGRIAREKDLAPNRT